MNKKIKFILGLALCLTMLTCNNVFADNSSIDKPHKYDDCCLEEVCQNISLRGGGLCGRCGNLGLKTTFYGWGDWTFTGSEEPCSHGKNGTDAIYHRRGAYRLLCFECGYEEYTYPVEAKRVCWGK